MTSSDIATIRAQVIRLELDGCDAVAALSMDELASVYNGTGPAFLPDSIRAKLDDAACPLLPAVMVHDYDFSRSNGRQHSFKAANDRFLRNCCRCACAAFPWHSWRRYALMIEAYALYRACERFGWMAWLSAYYTKTLNKGDSNE